MLGITFFTYNEKIKIIEFAYLVIDINGEEIVVGKIDRSGLYDAFANMLKKLERNEDTNPVGISDALFTAPLSPQIILSSSKYKYYNTDVFVGLSINLKKNDHFKHTVTKITQAHEWSKIRFDGKKHVHTPSKKLDDILLSIKLSWRPQDETRSSLDSAIFIVLFGDNVVADRGNESTRRKSSGVY